MSDAPLERLASREMALSRDEAGAEERMLGALAQIPDTALRTRERMQQMQLNDVQAQIKAEAVEQKRIEVSRRMQEAESLFMLRQAQAAAQTAKTAAERERFGLEVDKFEHRQLMDRTGTYRDRMAAEDMPDKYWLTPQKIPGTTKWGLPMRNGKFRELSSEEAAAHEAQLAEPAARNRQREAAAAASQARAESTDPRAKRLATIADAWSKAAAAVERAPKGKGEAAAAIFDTIQQEAKAAAEELRREGKEAPPPPSSGFRPPRPPDLMNDSVITESEYVQARQKFTDEQIREWLRKNGRLK